MNIDQVAEGDNDLARFMHFLNKISKNDIGFIEEDWGHMCGVTVSNKINDDEVCFNFYANGEFRGIITLDPKE
jgi:hypothetical protein